ncbi:MAG: SDR family oxidoreductase [Alphaproteobacteria bacterium]|nr:SDR family oxidoreductase [Alphaproteobacteria bacterium]
MITADLRGKRVLVTGASSGIGLATVTVAARCGARVALNHLADDPRGPEQVARLRGEGLDVIAAPGNVSKRGEAEAMIGGAIDALGGLDHLVNNAGTAHVREPVDIRDLDAVTDELWDAVLSTNLRGTFVCARRAAAALKAARGGITNIASVAGLNQPGSSMAYAASKAGVVSLTRNLARSLAPDVRVNAIAPGLVLSSWTAPWPEARKQGSAEAALLKRNCTPEDIADAVLFFIGGAAMVTGQVLVVDGGRVL